MTLRFAAGSLALLLAPCVVLTAASRPATAGDCASCPKTVFCRPKPPCIKYKKVCPKPVACPCEIEHFGYYPTCWNAWPFPADYSHCAAGPVPPMMMTPPPSGDPNPIEHLPTPKEMTPKVTLRMPSAP